MKIRENFWSLLYYNYEVQNKNISTDKLSCYLINISFKVKFIKVFVVRIKIAIVQYFLRSKNVKGNFLEIHGGKK